MPTRTLIRTDGQTRVYEITGSGGDVMGYDYEDGLEGHLKDTVAAHTASAILVDSTSITGSDVDVQAVLEAFETRIYALENP